MAESDRKYIEDVEEKITTVDLDKLYNTARTLSPWILILLLGAITISYVYLRYTKPVYESSSVLKLDIKNEVSALGFITQEEDQNYKTISSEIELLRSRLFFSKIINELNLNVTVFTVGKVLVDERYMNSPIMVEYKIKENSIYDNPINVEILNPQSYRLDYTIGGNVYGGTYTFGQIVDNEFISLKITTTSFYTPEYEDVKLYFLINSEQSLENYLAANLKVQPLNLNANTIEIAFSDNNQFKARDLVNAIDTIYLNYTRAEKNMANNQKIEFIDEQLQSTEERLIEFENYFENFTIQNKTTDLGNTLNRSIGLLNSIDSDQYKLRIKLSRLTGIKDSMLTGHEVALSFSDQQILPASLQKEIENINDLIRNRFMVSQSYKSNTQAYRKIGSEIDYMMDNFRNSLSQYINELKEQLSYLDKQRKVYENKFLSIPSKNTEYAKIQRYYKLYEDFYLSLMQKKAEFQLALAGTVTDFKILSSTK